MLLHWEDRNSMAHGIEARLPFLDYRLVEFNLGLPPEYKIYNGMTKFILREAMHGVLPDKISRRVDKLGFVTPEEIWMKKHQQLFRSKIETAVEQSHGVFNSGAISLFDDIVAGKQPFSFLPWRIINFGEWMELFDIHTCL
jgi:asparagine synthase (glutamine-hydrolysing)